MNVLVVWLIPLGLAAGMIAGAVGVVALALMWNRNPW